MMKTFFCLLLHSGAISSTNANAHFNHKLHNAAGADSIFIRDENFKSDPTDFELAAKDSFSAKAVNDPVTELAVLSGQDLDSFYDRESVVINEHESVEFNDHESALFNDHNSAMFNNHDSAVFNDHDSDEFHDYDSKNDRDRNTRTKRELSENNAISLETIDKALEFTSAESEFNLSKMELLFPTFLFGVNFIMFIELLRPVFQFIWNIITQLFLGIFTLL